MGQHLFISSCHYQSVGNLYLSRFSVDTIITGNTSNDSNSCIPARNASDAGDASNASKGSGQKDSLGIIPFFGGVRFRTLEGGPRVLDPADQNK